MMWVPHPCLIFARVGKEDGEDSYFGLRCSDDTRTFTTQRSWNPTLAQTPREDGALGMRGQAGSSDPAKVAEEITRLEQDRSKAQVQGDVSKLNELLASEFMEMNVAGQIRTKAENIQSPHQRANPLASL